MLLLGWTSCLKGDPRRICARRSNVLCRRDKKSEVILQERYFRRMDCFEGQESMWAEWLFNLGVAISSVKTEVWTGVEAAMKLDKAVVDDLTMD